MEDHQFSKQQFMTQQQQMEPAYNDEYVQNLEDEARMSKPLQMGPSENLSNADSLSRSGRKGDSMVSGNVMQDGHHPRPVFLKKKAGAKTMGLTKQFSSTLQISAPSEQRRNMDQHEQNILIEDAEAQNQQHSNIHYIEYRESASGVYDSRENIMDNDVFEKVGQQVNDSQDLAARSLLREIEAPEAEELEAKMAQPPILYANLDQLLEHPINLDSSNHLLDAILNNLQGLTPEQEAQKRQIEERSRLIQEQMRATKSAATPSLATTLNKPQAQEDAAESSRVELYLDNLESNLGQSRLSQPLLSPEDLSSKPPRATHVNQITHIQDSSQFQLDGHSQPLFPLTPPNEEQEEKVESSNKSKANSNYERLLQRHFGRTSSAYGARSKNGQIMKNDNGLNEPRLNMDKRVSGQDASGNGELESHDDQEITRQAGSMAMTLREQRDLQREHEAAARPNGLAAAQSARMRPKAYMRHTSVSAQKAKAINADQDTDHHSRSRIERRTKHQRKSSKKLTQKEREEQERLEDQSDNMPQQNEEPQLTNADQSQYLVDQNSQEPYAEEKDQSAEHIGAERGQAIGLRTQRYGASMGQQLLQSRSMIMTKSQKEKLYSTQNTARNPRKDSRQKQLASNKLSQSMTYASLSKRAVNQNRSTNGRKGSAPQQPRGAAGAASSGQIVVGGSQLVKNKGVSGGPHNIDDRLSARQLRSSRNPSMQDSQAFNQELDLSKTQSVAPGNHIHSSRPQSSRKNNTSFQQQFSGNAKPSDETLKIKHQQIQKEIEAAIKQASPGDGPSLNVDEFRQSLMNMNYLSALSDSSKRQFPNTTGAVDAEAANQLSRQLWTYLNPYNNNSVEKAATFDCLLLLMFNIGHQSERDMAHVLAVQIIQYYRSFDIFLKADDQSLDRVGVSDDGDQQEQSQPSNVEEQNVDLAALQSSLGNSMAAGALSSQLSVKAPSDVQIVDKFLTKRKQAWPLHKLIQAFKQDHGQRFAKTMHDRTSVERSSSKLINPLIAGNKSLQKIIPDDTRKYKDTAIKQLEKDYTFTPSMNATSRQLAKQNQAKVASERTRSRHNQKGKAVNSNVDMASNQGQARQHSLKAGEQSMPKDVPFEQMTVEQKIELMQYRSMVAEQRLQTERQLKESTSMKGCTFVPKTNRTGKQKYLTTRRPGDLQQPKTQATSQVANAKSSTTRQATKPVPTQPLYAKKGETKQLQLARLELQAKSDQELAECTFKPKIRAYTKKLQITGPDPDPFVEATVREFEQPARPKGYQEAVERIRKHQELKDKTKIEEERKLKGERYAIERLGLEKARPPSFLNKPGNSIKRPQLLSIEVSITPTRSGRIGIKEGDDLKVLAANFCKAYQLHRDMQESLVDQLQSHLNSYHLAKEMAKEQEHEKLEQQRSMREQRKLTQQQASLSSLNGSSPRRTGDASTRQPTQPLERQPQPFEERGPAPHHSQHQLLPAGQAHPDAYGPLRDLSRINSNYRQLNQDLSLSKIQDQPEESEDEHDPVAEAAPDNTQPLESQTSQPTQEPKTVQPHAQLADDRQGPPPSTPGSGQHLLTDIGHEYLAAQSSSSLDRASSANPHANILEQIRQANVAYNNHTLYNNHTSDQQEPSSHSKS